LPRTIAQADWHADAYCGDQPAIGSPGGAFVDGEWSSLVPRIVYEGDRVLEIGVGVGLIAMLCARICGQSNVRRATPGCAQTARHQVGCAL